MIAVQLKCYGLKALCQGPLKAVDVGCLNLRELSIGNTDSADILYMILGVGLRTDATTRIILATRIMEEGGLLCAIDG